mgnify:CR=1 FL=1
MNHFLTFVFLTICSTYSLNLDTDVYYGKVKGAEKPAEVVAIKVFEQIPEYQEIKKKKLKEDDPEYWVLLAEACRKFYSAVKKVATKNEYDCVVEKGKYEFKETPPDITQEVIDALEK